MAYRPHLQWVKKPRRIKEIKMTDRLSRNVGTELSLLTALLLLLIAVELSIGGSSPYASTDRTNKNECTQKKQYKNAVQTVQNTVNSSTHVNRTPTHTHTHTLKNK
jgi:hypothetical protein